MENTEILHGSTSISLPGIEGEIGPRARLFFYGNDKLGESVDNRVSFVVNGTRRYARKNGNTKPEESDYIFYSEGGYDYIYLIKSVVKTSQRYNCEIEEIDRIDLSKTESSSSGLTNFILNIVSRAWTRTVRIPYNYNIYLNYTNEYYVYPLKRIQTTYNLLYDFSLAVPSTSDYTFTSDIKITIEFNTLQSSQMDSMLFTKFDTSTGTTNTYRGDIEKYSIMDEYEQEQEINFDDERLENFMIVIKDYNDGVGSKYFTNSIPLMAAPLRRYKANPRAFLCVYTKEDYFIKKSVICELDLSFILNASATSDTPSVTEISVNESF